jgi:hypothetical protein
LLPSRKKITGRLHLYLVCILLMEPFLSSSITYYGLIVKINPHEMEPVFLGGLSG